ncbi:hypothetical protein KY290_010482 [Solanum tuberosum]|uniref:Uncharacterized protein n=1 Tax=Solanum tuberosum TaxID=4113 RepID=A0ABQ7VYI7_SOLTU|nr:hypothetical protein KY284_012258 [Solanum tuberosum]KAH0773345.1 hypothetical protein KY290_010482 [Solanum tuberosum]
MDDLFEENLDLWYYFDFFKQMIHLLQQIDDSSIVTEESFVGNIIYRSYGGFDKKRIADDVATDVGVDVDVDVNIGDAGAKSGGEHVDDVGGIYGGFTPSRVIHSIED